MKFMNNKPIYQQIMHLLPPMIYMDIGARAVKQNHFIKTFPQSQYIGFELDTDECTRLNALDFKRHRFYPQVIGRDRETRTLYVTRNPACSSLYEPNVRDMHRFLECGPFFEVLERKTVETVDLDAWCRETDVSGIDFLELDTQGSELDILQGCKKLLSTSILGLRVEVEFYPLYKDQPLFSDIDNHFRPLDYHLFDLSRYRLRRSHLKTRGQLLWGHAFYLKNVHQMNGWQPAQYLTLGAIASFYGFEDYALEVLETIFEKNIYSLKSKPWKKIQNILDSYSDQSSRLTRWGFQRLRKKPPAWIVSKKKDCGYFIKD
jgi:FkbM family methyltransferase